MDRLYDEKYVKFYNYLWLDDLIIDLLIYKLKMKVKENDEEINKDPPSKLREDNNYNIFKQYDEFLNLINEDLY